MPFLLTFPSPLSFLLVAVVTTAAAVWGLSFVRKRYPAEVLKENHEVAAIIFNAFGLLYGVVVAFVVFVTWSGYDDATKELQLEASDIVDIFYSAKAFPQPASAVIQQELMKYAEIVYNDELKRMSAGQISIYSGNPIRNLLAIFNGMDERSISNPQLYQESLRRLNGLAEHRRLRIFAGNNTVPATIWLVLLIGGLITVLYTYLFGTKNIRAQYLMIAALTITISWILLLIYILDHPFSGSSRVSIRPLADVIQIMKDQAGDSQP